MNSKKSNEKVLKTLNLLETHYHSFNTVLDIARETDHPVPMDTRGWSQIIVSVLTGIKGLSRKKGQDLEDGSDVKAANTWEAIDTPRFNGVIKAGTKSDVAGKLNYLNSVPYLFFVLWDKKSDGTERCRIWCVRPQHDPLFRKMSQKWYEARDRGEIISTNFQLHPPRGLDTNIIRNTFGNFSYPLLFCAERRAGRFQQVLYDNLILINGLCVEAE